MIHQQVFVKVVIVNNAHGMLLLPLGSEGYSQREIANKHQVHLAPVNRDIQYFLKLIISTFFNPSIIVIF
jgi:hypothetical protein